ncbi:MAG: NADH-quinone oxidoreductase subunit L [Gemmatales bacterium]
MPSGLGGNLLLIPGLPLLAAILTALFGRKYLKEQSHWPTIIAFALSFFFSLTVLGNVRSTPLPADLAEAPQIINVYDWITIGSVKVGVNLRADPLTAMMLVMVTFISTLVAIFSKGYMHGDPGYPRFFAAVALFVFCMTMLVLSNNFLLTFVFWEGVGLCSYLLIGYWFKKRSASAAARKAFLVNRIGDFGLILGMFTIWGFTGSLEYNEVFDKSGALAGAAGGWACFFLLMGAIGKSAQFPLHVWLPDAMEGPTPVSALIHAATMVTAGVYLIARCTPLFELQPMVQLYVSIIGGATAIIAAIAALTQNDLKRVMAYSTVSQLGYMFMALGAGAGNDKLVTYAVIAGMFHLFTHAFFKALLFLGSGSVMHAMGHVIDMRRFSGLRYVLPVTHFTFLIGCAALAGLPPFSGFYSKDEILMVLAYAGKKGDFTSAFQFLYYLALFTAFLTAFYTFRAYFLTFWGEKKLPPEAEGHAHEGGWDMTLPLIILAVGAIGVGYYTGPMTHQFSYLLERTPNLKPLADVPHLYDHVVGKDHASAAIMYSSIGVAGAGVLLAALMYLLQPSLAGAVKRSFGSLYNLSYNKLYFDELYQFFLVKPAEAIAAILRWVDSNIVDGLVDFTGRLAQQIGKVLQPVQNGLVQYYALATLLGLAAFAVVLASRLYQ